jgi:hypothetical protein
MEKHMSFVYHRVPSQLRGTVLYPLNKLKGIWPDLYKQEVDKYDGRTQLLTWSIEPLGCLWNDVLFFSPVRPQDIRRAMNEAGVKFHTMRFYQIPAARLDPQITTIRHYRWSRNEKPRYDAYDPCHLEPYARLSDATAQDYRDQLSRFQTHVFVFAHVPHILYKGTLDVSGLPIVEV